MRVVVSGASGLIGTALVAALHDRGDEVVRLTRGEPTQAGDVSWDPAGGRLDPVDLTGVEAAVHLSGAGVGDRRWSARYKREIRDSRVLSTRTLVAALRALDPLPRVLVSASGVGVYGDRGDEVLTEASAEGPGFLADVVRAWEAEAFAADPVPHPTAGSGDSRDSIRVATLRSGLVVAPHGGAFDRLGTLINLGLGGRIGNGRQWWPWITLVDEVAAILFLLDHDVRGPVNACSPNPERNADLIHAIAHAAHRPAAVPAPGLALRAVLGEFAGEILASQRAVPAVLEDAGFVFTHPKIADAAAWMVRGRRS